MAAIGRLASAFGTLRRHLPPRSPCFFPASHILRTNANEAIANSGEVRVASPQNPIVLERHVIRTYGDG